MRRTTDRRSAGAGRGNAQIEDLIMHVKGTYFKHPSHVDWMDETVSQWKNANTGKVQDATVKSKVEHHSAQIEDFLNNTLPDAIDSAKKALGL